MEKKEVKTYKPKKINIIKLEAYLKQIEDNGNINRKQDKYNL